MPFSGPARVEFLPDGVHVRVLERIVYTDAAGRDWVVPVGFTSDGASIPQALWSELGSPFTGQYRVAAIFHDAAYAQLGVTKDDADAMFRACAVECGTSHLLAELIFQGVRVGGVDAYADDQCKACALPDGQPSA